MRDIDNFFAAVIITCLLPMFPLGIECFLASSLSLNSLLLATLVYVLAASYAVNSASLMVLGGLVSVSLSLIYGFEINSLSSGNLKTQRVASFSVAWYAWLSLGGFSIAQAIGCYRKHVIRSEPLFNFGGGA